MVDDGLADGELGEDRRGNMQVSKIELHSVLTISLEPIEARISSPPPPTKRILYHP